MGCRLKGSTEESPFGPAYPLAQHRHRKCPLSGISWDPSDPVTQLKRLAPVMSSKLSEGVSKWHEGAGHLDNFFPLTSKSRPMGTLTVSISG